MRSLLVRIFVSFWAIILITTVTAATLGFFYAERARETIQNFEVSDAMLDASAALQENGRDGLIEWLRSQPGVTLSGIFVVDELGEDLLQRSLPQGVEMLMRRFNSRRSVRSPTRSDLRSVRPPPSDFRNLRPARPFTQLVGPDDHVYTLFVLPPQGRLGRWLVKRGGFVLITLALLFIAAISYWLARAISGPIRRFRESTVAIADGDLEVRVADEVGRRRDEIGLLAQDFDRMANKLQQAWNRQTELTRNVSHELRSPLARLRVALELARRKTGDLPEFDRIDTETGRLDGLIGQILEYSRLDVDEQEPRETVDLEELIQSVMEDVRYEYGQAGNPVGIAFESKGSLHFEGFPNALTSGVENVLRNAMQHSRNTGEVTVSLAANDSAALIAIADQGGGVAEDELQQIFEPFFRAPARYEANKTGSGLGLAIASRAIAMNGGTITARNNPQGLTVEIKLPL